VSTPTEAVRMNSMAGNQEYQRLLDAHARYAAELEQLTHKPFLTDEEKVEEVRLKKLKLRLKDQMAVLEKSVHTAA